MTDSPLPETDLRLYRALILNAVLQTYHFLPDGVIQQILTWDRDTLIEARDDLTSLIEDVRATAAA